MSRHARLVGVVAAIACLLVFPHEPAASPVTVDQANDGFSPALYQNPRVFAPFGQEFTPALDALDFVDLWSSGGIGLAAVRIREGVIEGPILGLSEAVPLAFGELRFAFGLGVSLSPGRVYVLEVVVLNGGESWLVGSAGWNRYPRGRQVFLGEPQAGNDLWFREGIPEPPIGTMMLVGLLLPFVRRGASALSHRPGR